MTGLIIASFFTGLIHFTESASYSMRIAGVTTRQVAIAMSFVTSTLLVSRLSNMFQAPLVGKMVDMTVIAGTDAALHQLESDFRLILFAGMIGITLAACLTPTLIGWYEMAIMKFLDIGSIPKLFILSLHPSRMKRIIKAIKLPRLHMIRAMSLKGIPKTFLILNILVAAIYSIGVLSALLAGAYIPEFRATAVQLSGIVNGIATIMFTLMVDPAGARITDQAIHGKRPIQDVKSVVFFLLIGRLLGVFIIAQLLLFPAARYIISVTQFVAEKL